MFALPGAGFAMTFPGCSPRTTALLAVVAFACGAYAPGAAAQTPAPAAAAAAPAAPTVTLPKPDCGEKPEHPGHLASDRQVRQWRTEANAYLECFKKFAAEQRAIALQYQEAANKLIDQYNNTVKEMQAAAEAAAQN
jgi:hypothetical protein